MWTESRGRVTSVVLSGSVLAVVCLSVLFVQTMNQTVNWPGVAVVSIANPALIFQGTFLGVAISMHR